MCLRECRANKAVVMEKETIDLSKFIPHNTVVGSAFKSIHTGSMYILVRSQLMLFNIQTAQLTLDMVTESYQRHMK